MPNERSMSSALVHTGGAYDALPSRLPSWLGKGCACREEHPLHTLPPTPTEFRFLGPSKKTAWLCLCHDMCIIYRMISHEQSCV